MFNTRAWRTSRLRFPAPLNPGPKQAPASTGQSIGRIRRQNPFARGADRIPITNAMSQALCTRMESWRNNTFQRSILVVGAEPLSTLHSFSAGLVLIAHIILIHVQRLTPDFRFALVVLLSDLRLIVLLGLIATLSAFSILHFGLRDYRVQSRLLKTRPPM
uniref:Uncharacterized protein n=1 Tax=mine drainage metagenome TaxID=410659 RepID=E6PXJ3_9ZZZZ